MFRTGVSKVNKLLGLLDPDLYETDEEHNAQLNRSQNNQDPGTQPIPDTNATAAAAPGVSGQPQSQDQSQTQSQGPSQAKKPAQSRKQIQAPSKGKEQVQGQSRRQSQTPSQAKKKVQSQSRRPSEVPSQAKKKVQSQSRRQSQAPSKVKKQIQGQSQQPSQEKEHVQGQEQNKDEDQEQNQVQGQEKEQVQGQEPVQGQDEESYQELGHEQFPGPHLEEFPDKYQEQYQIQGREKDLSIQSEIFRRRSTVIQIQGHSQTESRSSSSLKPDLFDFRFPTLFPTSKSGSENIPENGELISRKGLSKILSYLRATDIKTCRLVCHLWQEQAAQPFRQHTCFVISGDEPGGTGAQIFTGNADITKSAGSIIASTIFSGGAAHKCIKYLVTSTTKFSPWATLRLKQLKESQIVVLLNSAEFQESVKSVSELEMILCEMTWTSLLLIMKNFINLQCLLDNRNLYTSENFHQTDTTDVIASSSGRAPVEGSREDRIDASFIKRGVSIESLKCLKIYKPSCNWNTIDLLKILTVVTVDLHEFHFKADPKHKSSSMLQTSEFQRHLNILFILNSPTLQVLYIDMMETENTDNFNDFLSCFTDWSSTNHLHHFPLKELTLKFKYIWLSKSFDTIFISLLRKLTSLEVLGLGIIAFKPDSVSLLEKLLTAIPPSCIFEFGLYLTDHERKIRSSTDLESGEAEIEIKNLRSSKTVLKSPLYKEHMTDLLIGVFHDGIHSMRDLLPDETEESESKDKKRSFVKLTDLAIFTNGWSRPRFESFDIPLLTRNFGNLIKLEIVDGPWENYLEEDFSKISEAQVKDEDLQIIMKTLSSLETLMIFADMSNFTDMGATGLTAETVDRMNRERSYVLSEEDQVNGFSFSNLKYLRYLSLRGVGSRLTDATVYFGFNNLKYLKTLIVSHFTRLTPEGRDHINLMFPESNGCFVGIV